MQKGSLVMLKNTTDVFYGLIYYTMQGWPFPEPGKTYVMATDPKEYKCKNCEKIHAAITLEEIPGVDYNPEWFDEIQKATEVNIDQLVQESELVYAP